MVTPAVRREAVAHLQVAYEVSERRACAALGADRTSVRYRSRRPDDAAARVRLRELASIRRRFGYRRLHILLTREGIVMNHKKLRRLYREERLQVRRRGGRKRALGTRAPMALPQGPNQRWSLDFLSDAMIDGRRFRILAIVDDFTRECLVLIADTSLPGLRVARELDTLIATRGRPLTIVSDNGTELTGMTMLRWSQERQVEWHYIAPGKPQQNAFIESFKASIQDRDGGGPLLQASRRVFPFILRVYADCGYTGEKVAKATLIAVEIVRKNPGQVGFAVNPRRWVVERFFAWIGRNRRLLSAPHAPSSTPHPSCCSCVGSLLLHDFRTDSKGQSAWRNGMGHSLYFDWTLIDGYRGRRFSNLPSILTCRSSASPSLVLPPWRQLPLA
jgi:putative transposase